MKKLIFIALLIFLSTLNASKIYTLSGIKKAYLVVELSGDKIPKELKGLIYGELKETIDELNIDTSGYNQRSLAFLVSEVKVADATLINITLLVGEDVKRIDSNEKVFGVTYKATRHIIYNKNDDLEDNRLLA